MACKIQRTLFARLHLKDGFRNQVVLDLRHGVGDELILELHRLGCALGLANLGISKPPPAFCVLNHSDSGLDAERTIKAVSDWLKTDGRRVAVEAIETVGGIREVV